MMSSKPAKVEGRHAVDLAGGRLRGLTVGNARASDAAAMVTCGSESSEMTAVVLDGSVTAGGTVDDGVVAETGCALTDALDGGDAESDRVRVRHFADTGVLVDDGATVSLTYAKVYNNGGDGYWVKGAADLDLGEIAFNGDDGIFVDHSAAATFNSMLVRDNANNGVQLDGGDAFFRDNRIWNNPRSLDWGAAQVLVREAPTPDGSNTVLYWTGSACVPVYAFGEGFVDSCTDDGPFEPYPGGL